ncbi:MAG TPA: class I SAM-dependent methyltransferase [Thermoplasmata archaeon]|nr:class I SAM-dependent methyltransferase [Thermoplasmata archaeon]
MRRRSPRAAESPGVAAALRALGDRRARPDAAWVAALARVDPGEVAVVLEEVAELLPLERQIRAAQVAAGRTGYAQIRAPFELYALTRLLRPEHVVEAGVSSGVSSAHFLAALRRNRRGRLHSIDRPTYQRGPVLGPRESPVSIPPGRASGWAVPAALRARWDLWIGPAERRLGPLLAGLPSVGLFLHDDLHTSRHLAFELATLRPKLAAGAVVLADNTVWTGQAFPRFAASLGVPWHRRRRSDLVGLAAPEG